MHKFRTKNLTTLRLARVALAVAPFLGSCAAAPGTLGGGQTVRSAAIPIRPDGGHPDCAVPPGRNFDLGHWKVTLPDGKEIQSAELSAGFTMPDVFFTDPGSCGMVFRSPNTAGHTKGSKYSRSELREMRAPAGPAKEAANNWTTKDGGTLEATLRVDAVSTTGDASKVGRVVIGQIHGPDSEVVRLYFHKRPDEAKGRIYAGTDPVSSGESSFSEDIVSNRDGGGVALGETFSYRIDLHGLQLSVRVTPASGAAAAFTQQIDPEYAGLDLYFKAGVYNQNNTGDANDFAQATFFALSATHP